MVDPFNERTADFSGMTKEGLKDLFISQVFHKAFVAVNEEGSEAAAATAVKMMRKSLPRPCPEFCSDHPFLFMIVDVREQANLVFFGQIADPSL